MFLQALAAQFEQILTGEDIKTIILTLCRCTSRVVRAVSLCLRYNVVAKDYLICSQSEEGAYAKGQVAKMLEQTQLDTIEDTSAVASQRPEGDVCARARSTRSGTEAALCRLTEGAVTIAIANGLC